MSGAEAASKTESSSVDSAHPGESAVFGRHSNRLIMLDDCCVYLLKEWLGDGACVLSWDKPATADGKVLQVAVDANSAFGGRLVDAVAPAGARGRKLVLTFPGIDERVIDGTSETARLTCSLAGKPTISAADAGP